MLGRERHAEAEIGPHMIDCRIAQAAKDLYHRHAYTMQPLDQLRIGAFGRTQQQPVDAMLAHPPMKRSWRSGDSAVLARKATQPARSSASSIPAVSSA